MGIQYVQKRYSCHWRKSTWSHDNSYVFYIKCGSIKRTFTYVFTGTKTYNTDIFSASKHPYNYIFSAFKHTELTYRRHLKINPYEYWKCGINCIISCHINYLVFNCIIKLCIHLLNMKLWLFVLLCDFCCQLVSNNKAYIMLYKTSL